MKIFLLVVAGWIGFSILAAAIFACFREKKDRVHLLLVAPVWALFAPPCFVLCLIVGCFLGLVCVFEKVFGEPRPEA